MRLRSSGSRLRDLVPAYRNNPGNKLFNEKRRLKVEDLQTPSKNHYRSNLVLSIG
jgi:hypothetical protein